MKKFFWKIGGIAKKHKGFVSFVFLFVAVSFLPAKTFGATIPPIISYQGKVLENGESVTTTKAMGFLIYDAASGGNLVYTAAGTLVSTSTVNITPSQGIFNVDLGGTGTNALATSTFANYQNLYLEVVVGGHVLSPRKQITSVPYAVNSEYLSGVAARNTSSSSYIPIADDFGNFLFSGNSQSAGVSGGILYVNPSSTIPNGTLFGAAVNSVERFRVDTNGNVYASGTLRMAGMSTLAGFLSTASSTVNSVLTVSGLINASSSIFIRNSLTVNPVGPGFDLGRFFVDSSGNVSASGTIKFANLVSCNTIDTDAFGTFSCGSDETGGVGGASFNGFLSGPFFVTNGSTTSTLSANSFNVATSSANRLGLFSVDSYGNTSVSGTMNNFGTSTFRDLVDIRGKISQPRHYGSVTGTMFSGATDVFVQGNYAYVTVVSSPSAVVIVDISDKEHPRVMSTFTDGTGGSAFESPEGIFVQGNYAYVTGAADSARSFQVIDVSDPQYPRHAGILRDSGITGEGAQLYQPQDIFVQGNYAYVTVRNFVSNDALEIIDISDPYNPTHVGSLLNSVGGAVLSGPEDIYVSGNYAYIAVNTSDALEIVNVSNPANPFHAGSLTNGGSVLLNGANGVWVQGNYAYLSSFTSAGLEIVDISSSTNPVHAGSLENGTGGAILASARTVRVAGNYAYVVSGASSGALEIVDISSSTVPVHAGSLSNGSGGAMLSNPNDIFVQGNYAFIVSQGTGVNNDGIEVVDISGTTISNANVGFLKVGVIDAFGESKFDQSVNIRGGLSAASGLLLSGNFGMSSPTTTVTATNTLSFSHRAYFLASSSLGNNFIFDATNTPASASTNYLFSVRNRGTKMFSISTNGDVRATGAYFGSSATVGTPGAPGDLAERVDIVANEEVLPGDVMTINQSSTDTYEKTSSAYQSGVAGVISTNPTIVVGDGRTEHTAVMAMIGRVPLNISGENGPIQRGDILVSASIPGYAMKYDPATAPQNVMIGVVGEALDEFTGSSNSTGTIMALIRTGYINTNRTEVQTNTNLQALSVSQNSSGAITFPVNQEVNFSGNALVNIARLQSENNLWEITKDGELISHVTTNDGVLDLYGAVGARSQYILSGSGTLSGGGAHISFSPLEAAGFDQNEPIQVTVTLTGAGDANSLRVVSKDATGFTVQEQSGGTSQASFDWIVIGSRKKTVNLDTVPPDVSSPIPPTEEAVSSESLPTSESTVEDNSNASIPEESSSVSEPLPEQTTETAPSDTPTSSEPPQTEPVPADQTATP
ncbi:MAG: hypothetical protein KBD73_00285 [Candidatus Magasanikbacteria bacterium]|nr:hypothetical protein [Candidatus Magasanikbacteria bacterium]